ncbi:hypothetical protein GCM10023075_48370 [Streptosporangium album]
MAGDHAGTHPLVLGLHRGVPVVLGKFSTDTQVEAPVKGFEHSLENGPLTCISVVSCAVTTGTPAFLNPVVVSVTGLPGPCSPRPGHGHSSVTKGVYGTYSGP